MRCTLMNPLICQGEFCFSWVLCSFYKRLKTCINTQSVIFQSPQKSPDVYVGDTHAIQAVKWSAAAGRVTKYRRFSLSAVMENGT